MPEVVVKTQAQPLDISSPVEGLIPPHLLTFFSINPGEVTGDDKRMLSDIGRYLEGKEPFDAVDELRNIRFRLGTPQVGTTPLQHLHKYIKLMGSVKEQESQLKAMENV